MRRFGFFAIAFLLWLRPLHAQTVAEWHDRADQAAQSFLLKFWNGNSQYFNENYPNNGASSGYWTYANGWDAVLDAVERTGQRRYAGWIETLYLGQNERGWNADYYDDLCWMAGALIRSYDLTGDAKYLSRAQTIFADVEAAWDTTCCGENPGGVWWDRAHSSKATASNAGAALIGAKLYRRANATLHLDFAKKVFNYWNQYMVGLDGAVVDSINANASRNFWRFTYNEGLMIGAALELNEATGDPSYLTQAARYASFMRSFEVVDSVYGNVLSDGDAASCQGDCAQFKGPAYRQLARFYGRNTNIVNYFNVLKSSADAIWNLGRDASQNLFSVSWTGPSVGANRMLEQNAAATALSKFAQISGTYPAPISRYVFQAEEAVIHHISIEHSYPGFDGWAYLAGWNHDGQWVDFIVDSPRDTRYEIQLRYAAGAGDATRLIYVNGTAVIPNQLFAGTGGWNFYSTVLFTVDVRAGQNTISVIYNSSLGNRNFLNLDSLRVFTDSYVRPGPGALSVKTLRSNVTLNWFGEGTLQISANAAGPWNDAPGTPGSPATLAWSQTENRFYRLRQ